MQSRVKFTRKINTAEVDRIRAKYDRFISFSYDITRQQNPNKELSILLKIIDEYNKTTRDENIEVNKHLIDQLYRFKEENTAKSSYEFPSIFRRMLSLYHRAKIIPDSVYEDLMLQVQEKPNNEKSLEEFAILLYHKKRVSDFLIDLIKLHIDDKQMIQMKYDKIRIICEMFKKVDFCKFDPGLYVQLEPYGSFVNKLSLRDSDIDLTLLTNVPNINKFELLKFFYSEILGGLKSHSFSYEELRHADFPFIDITFKDSDIKVSFTVNNHLAVKNSRLIRLYSDLNPHCYLLNILVKIWATKNGIISARRSFLSSYAYSLLVISFLQSTNLRSLTPSIEKLEKSEKFSLYLKKGFNFQCRPDSEALVEDIKQAFFQDIITDKDSVLNLLWKFLRYYGDSTQFSSDSLSIRQGNRIARSSDGQEVNYLFSIVDPFDPDRNPGRHVRKGSVQATRILAAIHESLRLIKESDLKRIFYKKPVTMRNF